MADKVLSCLLLAFSLCNERAMMLGTDVAFFVGMKKHVSWTQISMAQKCGRQWEYRYVQGIKQPPKAAMIVGGAVHKTAEIYHTRRLQGLEELSAEEARVVASAEFSSRLIAEGVVDEDALPAEADRAGLLSEYYVTNTGPSIDAAIVEHRVEVPTYLDVTILGIIDVVRNDGCIEDLKITGKPLAPSDARSSGQLSLYAVLRQQETRVIPRVALRSLTYKKGGVVSAYHESTRTEDDLNRFTLRTMSTIEDMQAGLLRPAQEGAWWCSRSWCGYWDRCPYRQ